MKNKFIYLFAMAIAASTMAFGIGIDVNLPGLDTGAGVYVGEGGVGANVGVLGVGGAAGAHLYRYPDADLWVRRYPHGSDWVYTYETSPRFRSLSPDQRERLYQWIRDNQNDQDVYYRVAPDGGRLIIYEAR